MSIKAEANVIFAYWTNQANLEKWFLSRTEFRTKDQDAKGRMSTIEKTYSYTWMWYGIDNLAESEVL